MDFVDFDLAKKLKEKGFPQHWSDQNYILENEYEDDFFEVGAKYPVDVIYDYIPTIAAPTISQVLKWLRTEKEIDIVIYPIDACTVFMGGEKYILSVYIRRKRYYKLHHDNKDKYVKWEDAAIAGIEYVLNNLI